MQAIAATLTAMISMKRTASQTREGLLARPAIVPDREPSGAITAAANPPESVAAGGQRRRRSNGRAESGGAHSVLRILEGFVRRHARRGRSEGHRVVSSALLDGDDRPCRRPDPASSTRHLTGAKRSERMWLVTFVSSPWLAPLW
jgi:hypothetical protein